MDNTIGGGTYTVQFVCPHCGGKIKYHHNNTKVVSLASQGIKTIGYTTICVAYYECTECGQIIEQKDLKFIPDIIMEENDRFINQLQDNECMQVWNALFAISVNYQFLVKYFNSETRAKHVLEKFYHTQTYSSSLDPYAKDLVKDFNIKKESEENG